MFLLIGCASTTTSRASRGASTKPRPVALIAAIGRSIARSRAISTLSRARCDSSASFSRKTLATSVSRGTSSFQVSPSARTSANNTGRVASEMTLRRWRTTCRQASMMNAPEAKSASTSARTRGCSLPLASNRATGVCNIASALATSATRAGMPLRCAAVAARASAPRAASVRIRRMAMPATSSS